MRWEISPPPSKSLRRNRSEIPERYTIDGTATPQKALSARHLWAKPHRHTRRRHIQFPRSPTIIALSPILTELSLPPKTSDIVSVVFRAPLQPSAQDAATHIADITADQSFYKGTAIDFSAIGAGINNANPLKNDWRWAPTKWETNPFGSWNSAPYTANFASDTMSLGHHTLTVTFTKQIFNGVSWSSTGRARNNRESRAIQSYGGQYLPAPTRQPEFLCPIESHNSDFGSRSFKCIHQKSPGFCRDFLFLPLSFFTRSGALRNLAHRTQRRDVRRRGGVRRDDCTSRWDHN